MFVVEDEWDDEQDAKALTKTIFSSPEHVNVTPNAKLQGVGKKSLRRTLQSLGPVPDWSKTEALRDGSDSEIEDVTASSHPKRKKRIKKRKRGAAKRENTEDSEDQSVKEESSVVVPKKLKQKPIKAGPTEVKSRESIKAESKDHKDKKTELDTGTLTRKQWRNKMKNKKKCINKYLLNGECKQAVKPATVVCQSPEEEGQKVMSDINCEIKVAKTQPPTQKHNQHKEDGRKSQKRKKVQEENNITPIINTDTDGKIGKKNKGGSQVSAAVQKLKQELDTAQAEKKEAQHPEPIKRRKREENKDQTLKKEKLRRLLQSVGMGQQENPAEEQDDEANPPAQEVPTDRSSALRSRMEQRLESARFRYINEVLYTTTSGDAKRMFRQDPEAFGIYHRGFTAQVQRWPANPVDAIIAYIRHKPVSLVVADFGCGDCKIASSVKNKVHSFDLAPICDLVTVCDMANVPLDDATVDIAVFCLSLMGTNLGDFLSEANRVLVMGGALKIAEVASRFENVRSFMGALANLGFKLVTKDTENSHFYLFEFVKTGEAPKNVKAGLELRPCVYKKR